MTEPLSEPSLANGHAQNGAMAIGNGNHGNHMPLKPESSGMKAAEASGDAPSGKRCLGAAVMFITLPPFNTYSTTDAILWLILYKSFISHY